MSSHPRKKIQTWRKVPNTIGLYEYTRSGVYFANVKHGGRIRRESLRTKDLQLAKRALAAFKARLQRTDSRYGKISFVEWLEEIYFGTLKGAESTINDKRRLILRIKRAWLQARQPMRDLKPSDVERWLNQEFGRWGMGYYNFALSVIRTALQKAVDDHAITDNPAGRLKYRKRRQPIRLTPTLAEFEALIANIRGQQFSADAKASADFLEFMALAGVGQAEAASLRRCDVDLEAERVAIYRHKTSSPYFIPLFPQVKSLLDRLCAGKKPTQHLFKISQARKALTNACRRLNYPHYTQRSLRRLFITTAIERGVDIKTIALWQDHKDGGKLILDTYSFIRPQHSQRMAQLMTNEVPENIIALKEQQV